MSGIAPVRPIYRGLGLLSLLLCELVGGGAWAFSSSGGGTARQVTSRRTAFLAAPTRPGPCSVASSSSCASPHCPRRSVAVALSDGASAPAPTQTATPADVPPPLDLNHLPGIGSSHIVDSHSTFLLDMWGVMHDGSQPYDGVLDTIRRLREAGKRLVILSNSSKRLDHATKMLRKLGFDPDDFADIITSGEVSYRMLSGDSSLGCQPWPILTDLIATSSKKVFVLGSGDGDEEYCTAAGWTLSSPVEADLLLARGTFTINDGSGTIVSKTIDGEEAYFAALDEALAVAASRRIPMLVSNPDRVRPDAGLPPMPGAIGDSYEKALLGMGGEGVGVDLNPADLVKRIGKPHGEVYELAMMGGGEGEGPSSSSSFRDTIMVGDALETDVMGGMAARVTTLWVVKDGIHGPAVKEEAEAMDSTNAGATSDDYDHESGSEEVLRKFNERKGFADGDMLSPTYVVPNFRW